MELLDREALGLHRDTDGQQGGHRAQAAGHGGAPVLCGRADGDARFAELEGVLEARQDPDDVGGRERHAHLAALEERVPEDEYTVAVAIRDRPDRREIHIAAHDID